MPGSGRGVNILVVDGDPDEVTMISEVLGDLSQPRQLHIARSCREALDFLQGGGRFQGAPRPDLVLLDVEQSDGEGFAVLERIKRDPALSCIPVVMFSSSDDQADIRRAYALKVNSYLYKPMHYPSYVETLRMLDRFWFQTAALPGRRDIDALPA